MAVSAHGLEALRYLPLYYDNSDSHNSALHIILTLKPEWKDSQETIHLTRFTDGITNTVGAQPLIGVLSSC